MALTKREQVLIDRFKKSGRVLDQEKLNAPFGVLVRPLASVGIDSGKFALWFEEEISAGIKETGLTLPVRRIMISPHIINVEDAVIPSRGVTFRRKENAIYAATDIDFSQWVQFSNNQKLTMMYEHIKLSLLNIPQKHVGDVGREALLSIIDSAYIKLQSRLAH
jgi:hypothetical protein